MPDFENNWKTAKTAEKGAEWVPAKQPVTQPKNAGHTAKTIKRAVFSVSAVFLAVFRLFERDPLGTFFGCFPAVFKCRASGTSVDGNRDWNNLIQKPLLLKSKGIFPKGCLENFAGLYWPDFYGAFLFLSWEKNRSKHPSPGPQDNFKSTFWSFATKFDTTGSYP